jgi:hypothetical protein
MAGSPSSIQSWRAECGDRHSGGFSLPPAQARRGHNRPLHLLKEDQSMTSRRRFIAIVPLLGAAALARAEAPLVDPKDPQAVALGYTPDATKADKAKYPKYAPGQACGNCALYQGKAGDASGPCPLYAGKAVLAKAWCSAWVKRP